MAVSDSLALSSPYIAPKVDAKQERLRERRADLRPCPECGTEAEFEPPVITIQPGQLAHQLTVIRCPQCGTISRREILTEDYAAIQPREEPAPMITPEAPLCECGCGEPVTVDNSPAGKGQRWRRFASIKCSWRFANKNRPRKSSPTPAGEHAPTQPDQPPAGEGNPQHGYLSEEQQLARVEPEVTTPPPTPKPCDCGCGRPVLGTRRFARNECDKSFTAHNIAKAYLRKLTAEGRRALLDLVEAEERCEQLGVA